MRFSSPVSFAAAALASAALTGCSFSVGGNLDIDTLETTIATEMEQQLELPGTPTVTCPEEVPIEEGNVFTCVAELGGDSVDVEVTQTDDEGNVTWTTVPNQ